MVYTATRKTDTDFQNPTNINLTELKEGVDTSAITRTLQYINRNGLFLEFVFNDVLTEEDEDILDDICFNYVFNSTNEQNTTESLIFAILSDKKTTGSNGGGFSKNEWATRDLNTFEGITGFVTLDDINSQFTLIAGEYYITATAPAYRVNNHQIRLYNITDSVTTSIGTNAYSNSKAQTSSLIKDKFIITKESIFELQHRCSRGNGKTNSGDASDSSDSDEDDGNGFGLSNGFGENELYTVIYISKYS